MKFFNEETFIADLESQPWSVLEMYNDPDDALDFFIQTFTTVLSQHASLKQKRVKRENQPDWFNSEIQNAIRERDRAKKHNNSDQFKYWRNQVKMLAVTSKKNFYNKEINENKRNPKKLWKKSESFIWEVSETSNTFHQ